MKTAAVIAEWNPFHRGHAYFLQEVRRRSGADYIIAVMSGDFVQRGAPAIVNKYTRTKMALDGGTDLVIELPAAAASGSAGEFAAGAAALLERTGVVDELWFGSESGEIGRFMRLADLLADESPAFQRNLQDGLGSGLSYPAAYAAAAADEADRLRKAKTADEDMQAWFSDRTEVEAFLARPNNTLGLSYCIELKKRNSRIIPRTILRKGAGYHAVSAEDQELFPSAEGIRQMLQGAEAENASLQKYMPASAAAALTEALKENALVDINDFSEMLFYRLLQETAESLMRYHGMTESVANRILSHAAKCRTFSELAEAVKAKHLTRAGVDRILLRILLGIDSTAVKQACGNPLIRILGFRNCGPLLHAMHEKGNAPYEMRVSALPADQYAHDLFASNLYEWVRMKKSGGTYRSEFQRMVVK